jgi:hypothetical protein
MQSNRSATYLRIQNFPAKTQNYRNDIREISNHNKRAKERGIQMKRQYNLYKSLYGIGAAVVFFLLLFPVFRLISTDAQTTDTARKQELNGRIQSFFGALSKGNSALAFEGLLNQSPLGSMIASTELTEMRNKVGEFKIKFGEIIRWDEYDSKPIGEDIIVIRYILKYDQYPVIWTFVFYRKPSPTMSINNQNLWGLVEVHFDTNLGNL